MNSNRAQAQYNKTPTGPGEAAARSENRIVRWFKEQLFTIVLVLALIVGLGLLIYPSFADYWNSFHQSRAVMSYAESVANMNDEEYARILDEARIYNQKLAENGISIFAISTFNTDYILVKEEKFEQALSVLKDNGYEMLDA